MTPFLLVEELRRDLRAATYAHLTDGEVSDLRARLFAGHHNNAIEGIDPSPEMVALFEMFLQKRAPMAVSEPYLDRFIAARWHGV